MSLADEFRGVHGLAAAGAFGERVALRVVREAHGSSSSVRSAHAAIEIEGDDSQWAGFDNARQRRICLL